MWPATGKKGVPDAKQLSLNIKTVWMRINDQQSPNCSRMLTAKLLVRLLHEACAANDVQSLVLVGEGQD